jgi:hypothetical protein
VTDRITVARWLADGIKAAQAGDKQQALQLLKSVVDNDERNELAWLWLSNIVEPPAEKRICLENVLAINPNNTHAHEGLLVLDQASAVNARQAAANSPAGMVEQYATQRVPNVRKRQNRVARSVLIIIACFWLGLSIILIMGGILALGEWVMNLVRSRSLSGGISGFQWLELGISLSFVFTGLIGVIIAVASIGRQKVAYYASLIFAFFLLLLGPVGGLIIDPPLYAASMLIAAVLGLIIILTIMSQPALES